MLVIFFFVLFRLIEKFIGKLGLGDKSEVKIKGVLSGVVVGIFIFMFVVGIFGGLVVVYVIMKRRGISLF